MLVNAIAIQLLEDVIADHIKIINKREYFNLSCVEIMDIHKDEYFKEYTEANFTEALFHFHGF